MLRKYLAPFALCLALSMGGCAGMSTSTGKTMSPLEGIIQAQGCAEALAELTKDAPMDQEEQAQIENWASWLNFALKAAGIVVTAATGS